MSMLLFVMVWVKIWCPATHTQVTSDGCCLHHRSIPLTVRQLPLLCIMSQTISDHHGSSSFTRYSIVADVPKMFSWFRHPKPCYPSERSMQKRSCMNSVSLFLKNTVGTWSTHRCTDLRSCVSATNHSSKRRYMEYIMLVSIHNNTYRYIYICNVL